MTNSQLGTVKLSGNAAEFLNGLGVYSVPAGAGDVVGPGSATDNAIARFDGATGKLIQNSGITIADAASGTLSGSNSGDVTLAGETYITIAGQIITAAAVDLSGSQATGTLAAGRFPALTGDVTTVAGSLATTIANDAVTFAKFQNITDNRLLGRSAGSSGDMMEILIGSGLLLSGGTLTSIGTGGTVTSIATTSPISGGPITTTGTISLLVNVDFAWTAAQSITLTNATTAAADKIFDLIHNSSGTPAANFGTYIRYGLASSTTVNQDAVQLVASWSTATHATRTSQFLIQLVSSAGAIGTTATFAGSGNFTATGTITAGINLVGSKTGVCSIGGFSFRDATTGADSTALVNIADGEWAFTNAALNSVVGLHWGPNTASFPYLKRNATGIDFRLGDDSAYAPIAASIVDGRTGFRVAGAAASGNVLRGNGTNFVSAQLAFTDLATISITSSGLTMNTARLLGRTTAAAGAVEEITVGSGLTLSAGTLTATGTGGTVTSVAETFTGGLISVAGSPITTSGTFALTVAGTSGGVVYFSGATTWASSAALAANQLVLGGGAGAAPATLGSLGTTTTVLHGNAAGAPTFAAVSLTADVTGTLPAGNGGTGVTSLGNLTKVDDTNVTLTLGGTPTGALILATSLTLGWTGQLSVARGGTALGSIAGLSLLVANSANVFVALTPAAGQSIRINAGNTAWEAFTPGSGSGTVTSIATTSPISGGTITTTGTLTLLQMACAELLAFAAAN